MLIGDLDLNAAPAVNALNQVDRKFSATTSALASMGSRLGPLVAGFVTFGAVTAGLKESLDLGGTLTDLSARTGEAVGDLVILRQLFDSAGVGAEKVEPTLLKLQDGIAGINADSKGAAAALQLLGTSADELRSLTALEQIEKLTAGFAELDQTARVAAARDIFGKGGGELLSVFGDPAALDTARQQAGALADVMDRNAAAFDNLGDVIGAVRLNSNEFFAGVLSQVAPQATSIAEAFERIDFVEIGEGFGTIANAALSTVEALAAVGEAVDGVAEFFLGPKAPELSAFDEAGVNRRRGLGPPRGSAMGEVFDRVTASPVGSLQRIGGGGGGFAGSDPLLTESQRQTRLLERIAAGSGPATRAQTDSFSRPVPV